MPGISWKNQYMLVLSPFICHISATYLSPVCETSWPLLLQYLLEFKTLLFFALLLTVTLAVSFWIFPLFYPNELIGFTALCCSHGVLKPGSTFSNMMLFLSIMKLWIEMMILKYQSDKISFVWNQSISLCIIFHMVLNFSVQYLLWEII